MHEHWVVLAYAIMHVVITMTMHAESIMFKNQFNIPPPYHH